MLEQNIWRPWSGSCSQSVCVHDQLHCQRGDHCSGGSHTKTKTLFTCVCVLCVCVHGRTHWSNISCWSNEELQLCWISWTPSIYGCTFTKTLTLLTSTPQHGSYVAAPIAPNIWYSKVIPDPLRWNNTPWVSCTSAARCWRCFHFKVFAVKDEG